MMIRVISLLMVLSLPLIGGGKEWKEDDIAGKWYTEKKDGRILIYQEKNGTWSGKIVWQKESVWPEGDPDAGVEKRDRKNPDPALRDRPLIGMKILEGFTFDGENEWKKGRVYNLENGKTYKSKITLKDRDRLILRGYVLTPILGASTIWTRYTEDGKDSVPEKSVRE